MTAATTRSTATASIGGCERQLVAAGAAAQEAGRAVGRLLADLAGVSADEVAVRLGRIVEIAAAGGIDELGERVAARSAPGATQLRWAAEHHAGTLASLTDWRWLAARGLADHTMLAAALQAAVANFDAIVGAVTTAGELLEAAGARVGGVARQRE